MKIVNVSILLMVILFVGGCNSMLLAPSTPTPLSESKITFYKIQSASRLCIEDLILDKNLNNPDKDKPFIIIENIKNSVLPHIKTDFLAQDVRLSILLSDKAVTTPALKNSKKNKNKLSQFDYSLSGEVCKEVLAVKDGTVDCFSIKYKLKDLKSNDVVWEKREVLVD